MSKQSLTAVSERRAHVRYAHALRTTFRPLGREGGTWTARVCDVSRNGLGLVMAREVRVGTVLVVALEGIGGRFARPILARVMRVRPEAGKGWSAGCTFVTPLADHDIEALLLASGEPGA